jgi:protein gp37
MQKSNIQWTDATWNPTRGCDKISPGCKFCYAEVVANRFKGVKGNAYEQGFALRLVPEKLQDPLRWKRPQRIFVNSMSDLFHEGVPFEFIDKVFAVMAQCPQHTFQILTKRSARMAEYCDIKEILFPSLNRIRNLVPAIDVRWPLPNVILGVSAENQEYANKRVPEAIIPLLDMGWKTMISAEPLLGPIVFKEIPGFNRVNTPLHRLWVIVGGESGHGARPMQVEWARDIVTQCRMADVKTFVKQYGARPFLGSGQRLVLKSKKGDDMCEWEPEMRVQEFL